MQALVINLSTTSSSLDTRWNQPYSQKATLLTSVKILMVVPVQVSEGFDGQTRTELLEAGNELDRVKTNFETLSSTSSS